MKSYEEAKKSADLKIERLELCIRNIKKNYTYDFKCPSCHEIKKRTVFTAKIGKGRKYCSDACRSFAYRKRHGIGKKHGIVESTPQQLSEKRKNRLKRRKKIIEMRESGRTFNEIAKKLNVSRQYVHQLFTKAKEINEIFLEIEKGAKNEQRKNLD